MSWREDLQPASLRGAPFYVESAEGTHGRRVQIHEYPLRDKPWSEDLGRRAREFNIEGYVLGDDYRVARDALLTEIEKPGPAALVHPYYGNLQVVVTEFRIRENASREGGMARFSISCAEAGELVLPTVTADTQGRVNTLADAAQLSVADDFSDQFTIDDQPGWVVDEAAALLDIVDSGLPAAAGRLRDLMALPKRLAFEVTSRIDRLRGLRSLFGFGDRFQPVTVSTPSRRAQAVNQASIINLVERAALVSEVRASAQNSFVSRDQAVTTRDDLAERLDLAMETASDPVCLALGDLRVAMVRDLTERAADLRRIQTHTPAATLPALVVAHQLYGDANREAEVVARNAVVHPGFLTGGQALEVLSA